MAAESLFDQSPRLSMGQLGFGSLSKSHGLVHETGLAPEHAPDPSEHEASSLAKLAKHKSLTKPIENLNPPENERMSPKKGAISKGRDRFPTTSEVIGSAPLLPFRHEHIMMPNGVAAAVQTEAKKRV